MKRTILPLHRTTARASLALAFALCAVPAAAQELFVGSSNTLILKGDAKTGGFQAVSACGGQVNSMVLDGDTLHVGDRNGNVYIFDDTSGAIAYAYTLDTDARALTRDAGGIVVGGSNGKIFVVNPATGIASTTHQVSTSVDALALRGDTLMIGSIDTGVWIGNVNDGNFFNFSACGNCGPIQSMALDDAELFMGDVNGNIYHYNFHTGALAYAYTVQSDATALAVDGNTLLIGGTNGVLLRVDRNSGQFESSFTIGMDIQAIAIAPTPHPGTAYCFGVGCPCGNDDPAGGCLNSTGLGARLVGTGSASVTADDLVLEVDELPLHTLSRFYMSNLQTQLPFADGWLCAGGGGYPSFRFRVQSAGPAGRITLGPGIAGYATSHFGATGQIAPGTTWNFQAWYRNSLGPCGHFINVSNAYSVAFGL